MDGNNFVVNPFCQQGTIFENGYGLISKNVMRDKRLSAEAKCIYAYIVSFAGSKLSAFPGIDKMLFELSMSKDRFYKYRKQLIDLGYIEIKQDKSKGKFSRNVYSISLVPLPENKDTENPDTGNKDSNNNRLNSNRYNNNRLLHFLRENGGGSRFVKDCITVYLDIRSRYKSKEHKRVTSSNLKYIYDVLTTLEYNGIEIEEFKEVAEEYLQQLNKSNDGDIVCFLKTAQKRYFDLNCKDIVLK